MSAVAFFSTNSHTVLVSDGLAINTQGLKPSKDMVISEDRITDRNTRKVARINDSVGIAWTGNLLAYLQEFIEAINPYQPPGNIASDLTDLIQGKINSSYSQHMPYDWFNVNVNIIGYDNGKPMYYHIVKKNGGIVLEPGQQLPHGAAGCSLPFCDNGQQLYNDYLEDSFINGMNIKYLAVNAFKRLIEDNKHDLLGGTIFSEIITNPGK